MSWPRHSGFKAESIGRPGPSFPRRRAVHRDENDEERSSSALKAHTLAQRDQRLDNPQGGAHTQPPTYITKYRHGIKMPMMKTL